MTSAMSARGTPGYVYFPDQSLGAGATASVFTGRHKKKGWTCAVKVYHTLNQSEAKYRERELEVMKRLSHENIVKFLAIEQENLTGRHVLIMELCSGGSLLKILEKPENSHGFSEDEFLVFFKDITNALTYLHSQRVVHRDIKPGNILCHIREDSTCVYKLTDFGASKELRHNDEPYASLCGTEEYLHPEVYKAALIPGGGMRRGQFDSSMDLWSLGVTLYQAATGQLPFQSFGGRINKDAMYSIISQKKPGIISGVQKSPGGPIIWSKNLPATCRLSRGLKVKLVKILDQLMESDARRRWDFARYFVEAQRVISALVICYFCVRSGREDRLYANREEIVSEAHLKDALAEITELPESNQIYVHERFSLAELLQPITAKISSDTSSRHAATSSPTNEPSSLNMLTSPESPLYIVPRSELDTNWTIERHETPKMPVISVQQGTLRDDVIMAKEACSYAIYIKSCIAQLHRYQHHYIKLVQILRNSLTQSQMEYNSTVTGIVFITEPILSSIEASRCSQLKADLSKLQDDAAAPLKSKSLHTFLSTTTACTSDSKCMNTVTTIVKNMEKTLQEFKQKGPELSHNDEQIHRFEKKQMLDSASKIYTIYKDQCSINTDAALFQFTRWHRVFSKESDSLQMEAKSTLLNEIKNQIKTELTRLIMSKSKGMFPADPVIVFRDPGNQEKAQLVASSVTRHPSSDTRPRHSYDSALGDSYHAGPPEMDIGNIDVVAMIQGDRAACADSEDTNETAMIIGPQETGRNLTPNLSDTSDEQLQTGSSQYNEQGGLNLTAAAARKRIAQSNSTDPSKARSMPSPVSKLKATNGRSLSSFVNNSDVLNIVDSRQSNVAEIVPREEFNLRQPCEPPAAISNISPSNLSSGVVEMSLTRNDSRNNSNILSTSVQSFLNKKQIVKPVNSDQNFEHNALCPVGPLSDSSLLTKHDNISEISRVNNPSQSAMDSMHQHKEKLLSNFSNLNSEAKQRRDSPTLVGRSINVSKRNLDEPKQSSQTWPNAIAKEFMDSIWRTDLGNLDRKLTLGDNVTVSQFETRNTNLKESRSEQGDSSRDELVWRTSSNDRDMLKCHSPMDVWDESNDPISVLPAPLDEPQTLTASILGSSQAVSVKIRGLVDRPPSASRSEKDDHVVSDLSDYPGQDYSGVIFRENEGADHRLSNHDRNVSVENMNDAGKYSDRLDPRFVTSNLRPSQTDNCDDAGAFGQNYPFEFPTDHNQESKACKDHDDPIDLEDFEKHSATILGNQKNPVTSISRPTGTVNTGTCIPESTACDLDPGILDKPIMPETNESQTGYNQFHLVPSDVGYSELESSTNTSSPAPAVNQNADCAPEELPMADYYVGINMYHMSK